jgi:hypothetical protein
MCRFKGTEIKEGNRCLGWFGKIMLALNTMIILSTCILFSIDMCREVKALANDIAFIAYYLVLTLYLMIAVVVYIAATIYFSIKYSKILSTMKPCP